MAGLAGRCWQRIRPQATPLVFWAGMAVAAAGFAVNRMWRAIPWDGASVVAGLALVSLGAALVVHYMTRVRLATAAVLTWLGALAYFAGGTSCAAALLVALAAMAVGSLVIPAGWAARPVLAMLAGLGLIAGTLGWLLPFPLHSRLAYAVVLSTAILVRWRAIGGMLDSCRQGWCQATEAAPFMAWLAVTIAGTTTSYAWLPTIGYDDQAFHLGLPLQLLRLGYYQMNAASNIWAVSPWISDVVQGVTAVLAGHVLRGVVDVMWLVAALGLLWKLCEAVGVHPRLRWAAVALYASLPMTAIGLMDMHTEGPTAALAAGIALLIQRSPGPDRRQLIAFGVLFGATIGLKISNLLVAGPLGLWLLWRWRGRLPWHALPLALLLAVWVGGASYAYAWGLTGNPVLPMFNGLFRSAYFKPVNFHDSHWDAGFDWQIPWNLVFHTSRFFEGADGSAGFVLVALGGCALLTLARRDSKALALVALAIFFLPLSQIQYVRYTHPAMVLLLPVMLRSVPEFDGATWRRPPVVGIALVLLAAVGSLFVPAAAWQLRTGALRLFLTGSGREFNARYAPMQPLAEMVAQRYGKRARVFVASMDLPYAGLFAGQAFVVTWYDPVLSKQASSANGDPTGVAWTSLLERTGANLVVLQHGQVAQGLAAAVERAGGELVGRSGPLELWDLAKGKPGRARQAQGQAVKVQFDTTGVAAGPVLARARLAVQCSRVDVPVVVTWAVQMEGRDKPWTYSEWEDCLADATARPALSLASPRPILGFDVTLQPLADAGQALTVVSARLDLGSDLVAERDLSAGMRRRWATAAAAFIDPWSKAGTVRAGVAGHTADGLTRARFDVTDAPPRASLVRAEVRLRCVDRGVPIVIGWKFSGKWGELLSRYEWAYCREGMAHATLDATIKGTMTSFVVDANPSQPADLGLEVVSARAVYLARKGVPGWFNRKRVKLSRWLAPEDAIERFPAAGE